MQPEDLLPIWFLHVTIGRRSQVLARGLSSSQKVSWLPPANNDRECGKGHVVLFDLTVEIIQCHSHHALFIKGEPPSPSHTQGKEK